MKKHLHIAFLFASLHSLFGQTFSTNTSAAIGAFGFGYLSNGIAVSGLGNLDGINLGITSVEMTITAGSSQVKASVEMYLVAPDGHAVYLMNQGSNFFTTNGLFIFTADETAQNFRTWPGTVSSNNTYSPYGNLNSFNINLSPNGNWRLYAVQKNFGQSAAVTSWKINFGTSNIAAGNTNQSCSAALPLINTTQTGNFVSGSNQYSGIVVADSRGSEVGNSGLTESSVWFSFVPKCRDDKIEISGRDGYIQASVLGGNCGSRTRISTNNNFFNTTHTFNVTTYTPGNTYFVLMDGSEAGTFQYQVKWFEGTTGCATNSITTSATPKTNYCVGDSIYVAFTSTGTYATNNRFTAELSDANGSFSTPTIIGFKDAATGNTIPSKLPTTLASGTGYKIRINASNPAVTGTANAAFQILNIPVAPTSLVGSLSVCAGAANQTYSVNSVAEASRYRWKFSNGTIVTSSASDSINVRSNIGASNSSVSVQAVNACGASAALQRTITVSPNLIPSISVDSSLDTICQGDSVWFTASAIHGGANPSFQWKINQTNAGQNANVFRTKALKKSDTVSVILTSNETCVTKTTATSNKLVVFVRDTLKPTVSILGSNSFCQGSMVNFSASTQNKGSSPVFSWYVNKTKQTATDSLFSSSSLQNNDTIRVQLQSNKQCARPNLVLSNYIAVKVVTSILPTVSILGSNSACEGSVMTFNANYTGGGANPVFTWKLNNQIVGGNTASYSNSQFKNGDILTVEMKSDDACANPTTATSGPITLSIQTKRTPTISLQSIKTGICQGDSFSFQAQTTFQGTAPIYIWKVNNVSVPNSTNQFASKNLKNGDSVKVELTSSEVCLTSDKSNAFKTVAITDTVVPTIVLSGSNSFCQGSTVNFSASTKNKGNATVFSWYVNKSKQPAVDSLFSTSSLIDKDSVWVVLESNATCVRQAQQVSSRIVVSVSNTLIPSISIPSINTSCTGSSIDFVSQSDNAGSSPVYSWYVNDVLQSNLLPTFSGNQFINGDKIQVRMQSSEPCAVPSLAESNSVILVRKDILTPTVVLTGDSVFCKEQAIPVFTSTTQAGQSPLFAWEIENNSVSETTSSPIFEGLSVGEHTIKVTMTSSEACTSPVSATKNILVKDSVSTNVSITGETVLCAGSDANFKIVSNPNLSNQTFNWLKNGNNTGNTEAVFQTNTLANNDQIVLQIETDETCIASKTLTSNTLNIEVISTATPELNWSVSKTEICPGEEVIYSTSVTNAGNTESYKWLLNTDTLNNETGSRLTLSPKATDVISLEYNTILDCGTFSKTYNAPTLLFKNPAPVLTAISGPSSYCASDAEIVFQTDLFPNANYAWSFPSFAKANIDRNTIRLNLNGNTSIDTLKVSASNECGTGNTVRIVMKAQDCFKLFIPNAILATDEQGNNIWQIKGMELYPNAKISVFNRWGMNVYQATGYTKPFDGTINGKPLPSGTYYYVIDGIQEKPLVGDLTIVH